MDEVREYGKKNNVETVKIFDSDRKPLKMALKEDINGVSFPEENFFSLLSKLENKTFIHNHPMELPLSEMDIFSALEYNVSKMTAITPSGGFSSLKIPREKMLRAENEKVIIPDDLHNLYKEIEKMSIDGIQLFKKLGVYSNNGEELALNLSSASPEIIKEIGLWRIKKIKDMSDKYGLEFKYKLDYD